MKNYFSFNLTGEKLLPIWILYYVLIIAPYITLILKVESIQRQSSTPFIFFFFIILIIIVALFLSFYITKLTIENIAFKDKSIVFTGNIGEYIGIVLLGLLLSIITLGIYMPWFVRNMHRFFINNSSYNSQPFNFKGKGGELFVIILLSVILPTILLTVAMAKFIIANGFSSPTFMTIQQLVMTIIMVPYMYLVYKWMVNIDFKEYKISWETDFWNSCGKIAVEMLLSLITIGIYMPLAMLRLYKYFADKTIAKKSDKKLRFGYDINQSRDFLFIWGQLLLTIFTLGFYFPWAFTKIGTRILGNTYLEEEIAI